MQPVYVQFGLAWEAIEKETLRAYVQRLDHPNLRPPVFLDMPVQSLYGAHWSTTGEDVPGPEDAIDSDYLPGRNVLLVGVTAVWCAIQGINRIAIGSLLHNPYADATPQFFDGYAQLLSAALSRPIQIEAPYRGREKSDLIRAHAGLPLHLTLTCIAPKAGPSGDDGPLQCGACLKCRERHDAFVEAGVPDPTRYAVSLPV